MKSPVPALGVETRCKVGHRAPRKAAAGLLSGLRILVCVVEVGSELAGPEYSLAVKIFHFLTSIFYLIYMFLIEGFDISYYSSGFVRCTL